MDKDFIERIERCSNLCADYKELFGVFVPLYYMYYDIDTLADIVELAIINGRELKVPENN